MVVGCKTDLIADNRAQYLLINTKVLKILKDIDKGHYIQYTETGYSKGMRKIPQEDIKMFLQKVT